MHVYLDWRLFFLKTNIRLKKHFKLCSHIWGDERRMSHQQVAPMCAQRLGRAEGLDNAKDAAESRQWAAQHTMAKGCSKWQRFHERFQQKYPYFSPFISPR